MIKETMDQLAPWVCPAIIPTLIASGVVWAVIEEIKKKKDTNAWIAREIARKAENEKELMRCRARLAELSDECFKRSPDEFNLSPGRSESCIAEYEIHFKHHYESTAPYRRLGFSVELDRLGYFYKVIPHFHSSSETPIRGFVGICQPNLLVSYPKRMSLSKFCDSRIYEKIVELYRSAFPSGTDHKIFAKHGKILVPEWWGKDPYPEGMDYRWKLEQWNQGSTYDEPPPFPPQGWAEECLSGWTWCRRNTDLPQWEVGYVNEEKHPLWPLVEYRNEKTERYHKDELRELRSLISTLERRMGLTP